MSATVVNGWTVINIGARAVSLRSKERTLDVRLPETIIIPSGQFLMGGTCFTDEYPVRQVTLSDYAIGKYPVTNGEWIGFLQVMGKTIPELVANSAMALHPVVNVSWNDATDYCLFLMEVTGRKFGLPTEAQWEFAARGTDGREYPWGNDWDASRVVFSTTGTQPVNTHPEGASPFRAMHMSGNVWEWCADWYGKYTGDNLTDPIGPESGSYRPLRGGSWCTHNSYELRSAIRSRHVPECGDSSFGFRVVEVLTPEQILPSGFIEDHKFIERRGIPFRIMANELTTGQFGQFVRSAPYNITGDNAERLKALLAGTDQSRTAVYLSWNDVQAYAEWLNGRTGRAFRLPTEQEWIAASREFRETLSGDNWEWTATPNGDHIFVLCSRLSTVSDKGGEGSRRLYSAGRLIEDKK